MQSEVKSTSMSPLIPRFILQELGLVAIESNKKDSLLQALQQGFLYEEPAKLMAVQTREFSLLHGGVTLCTSRDSRSSSFSC